MEKFKLYEELNVTGMQQWSYVSWDEIHLNPSQDLDLYLKFPDDRF